ncbi:PREDICTED: nuclear factor 7, ovary-like [Branchiostoma belcheri]|uniref:Nuclear factor 7, ovary-like n=1 Tax=Branchiostoma belcheri TaxID=7741 RepID=A0A6P4XNT8_BRABE|nr:PREDICTED: nuclear factor 7, ovary-like [Branchiostoma belcheri]
MWAHSETDETDSSCSEDNSICGICRQALQVPRTLPCRHVFCGACLDDLARRQSPLVCPICESPAREPALSCTIPQQGKAVVGLSLVKAVPTRRKSFEKCSEHPQKWLALQCRQCAVDIFKRCLGGTPAKQVDSKQRTEDFLRNLDNLIKSSTENHLQTKQRISDQYDLRVQKLLHRRDVLLREVDDNLEHNMAAIAREGEIAQNQLKELNKVQSIKGKKGKLTNKSRNYIAIPVLPQPSTTSFEAIDADLECFIGRVTIHRPDQECENGGKKTDGDEDVGCFSSPTNKKESMISYLSCLFLYNI